MSVSINKSNLLNTRRICNTRSLGKTGKYIFLSLYGISTLYPLFWTFLSSLKSDFEILSNPLSLPLSMNITNYVYAWNGLGVTKYLSNSVYYLVISTLTSVLLASMAAYILTRIKPLRFVLLYFTLGLMLPMQSIILPFIMNLRKIGLSNTRTAVILVYITCNLPFNIFVLSGFMKSIPKALEEAATIDGCGYIRAFFKIVLPVSTAGIATAITFTAVNCWNDFFIALFVASSDNLKTLNLALYYLKSTSERQARYALMAAAAIILVIPILIVYVLFQKQIVKGITSGAIKE